MTKRDERSARSQAKAKASVYQKNKTSYSLGLLAVLLEAIYAVLVLDKMQRGPMMGAVVAVNILLLFGIFTASIKMNAYSREWAFGGMGIAGFLLLRLFVFLPVYIKPTGNEITFQLLTLICALLMLSSGVLCWIRHDRRKSYLHE